MFSPVLTRNNKMPEINEKIKSLCLGEVSKIDIESRTITACISTEEIDRHNEIVSSKALAAAIPAFAKNPVACACHQRYLDNGEPPVVGSWKTDTFKQTGKKSYMDVTFATTELAEKYWILYRDKHMRAFSISFRPKSWHDEKTPKNGFVVTFDQIELTEISPVAIGANANALSKAFDLPLDAEAIKTLTENYDNIKTSITDLSDKMDLLIDTISDRSDFGDELLNLSNKSNPIKQNAETTEEAEKQDADTLSSIGITLKAMGADV